MAFEFPLLFICAASFVDSCHVLFSFYRHLKGNGEPDLPFKIELWDDHDRHVEEVIALTSDFANACGAYEEAVKCGPGKLITLRQKARVIKKSR